MDPYRRERIVQLALVLELGATLASNRYTVTATVGSVFLWLISY